VADRRTQATAAPVVAIAQLLLVLATAAEP